MVNSTLQETPNLKNLKIQKGITIFTNKKFILNESILPKRIIRGQNFNGNYKKYIL
jgi:hypothetical protein